MSHFLWVEDFAGNTLKSATETVFGELLNYQPIPDTEKSVKKMLREHGIFVEFTFLGGVTFVRDPQKLLAVDYVILDIDLPAKSDIDTDDHQWLAKILQDYYGYQPQKDEIADEQSFENAKEQLIPVAGYQLYIELVMELGFPKEYILFCSNHANEQKAIQAVFKQARIELPQLLSKDEKTEVQTWIRKCQEDHYSRLRRSILNVINDIEIKNRDLTEAFKQDIPVNRDTFLEGLKLMLTQHRKPSPPQCQYIYRILSDYLTKYFDRFSYRDLYKGIYKDNHIPKEYTIPAYFVRNWVAHNLITNANSEFSAQDIGFLFNLVIKAMFDYSSLEMFQSLYNYQTISDQELQATLIDLHNRHYNYSGQCEIFELIRLKGQKNCNQHIEQEDFVAQMYTSFLFGGVELKSRTRANPFTDKATVSKGFGYWLNLTYLIDSKKDAFFESLKSIAYHRLKERNF